MSTRIYVACLASYNNGKLHGEHIDDLDMFTGEEVKERIAEMLARSPEPGAEEWAIHDHEGFGSYRVGEWHDLEELCDVARLIDSHGNELAEVALEHADLDRASEWLAEHYQGEWRNIEEYAEQWLDDMGWLKEVPESLRYHIDFASWARDAQLGGDIFVVNGGIGVHVFDNH